MGATRRDLLETFCREHDIEGLYSFGSRAEEILQWLAGEPSQTRRDSSDVDIGAKPSPARSYEICEKALMAVQLEDLFDVYRVDLVMLPEADPFLAANIIRGERLYSRDGHMADEYELYVLRRAGDLAPLERERLALVGNR